ncbi:MAG: DEAD/DEAH box helicase family protein [Chloroflexi bacterium]|nr:DEAD/DEAH box helicase family protein [Chloroflexota bacterium]MCL5274477.1 DEAD/DEAH box helicase family protein [Chloroflexota bacterium]
MPRKPRNSPAQPGLLEARVATAPCVPAIREALKLWRDDKYKGVTDTTRALLNYWFRTEHRLPDGRKFEYHYFQREAIETLIYLYEVAQVRRHKDLLEKYAATTAGAMRLLQYDDFARYCVKMATGSGKTKVMALALAWQYFNAVAEARDDYAKAFLLIAPNVIVYERLKTDFAGGRIFRADPVVPPELRIYWDFQCYMRDEGERSSSIGALYLTNIHQLYDRANTDSDDEPDIMTSVLGQKPPANPLSADGFDKRILARGGPLLLINDEAHHTHDEDSEWNKNIRSLSERLAANQTGAGLLAQLDFTATPRHSKGSLFTWTVYDYPLKQAIIDNVVKRPIKGVASGIKEQPSQHASVKYRSYLTAGVERWREYREQLAPLKKKPVLFVMMNDTTEADEVGEWLQSKYPDEFGGEGLLIIHTDKTGEVSRKDLEKARKTSRQVDEETSPVNCIVSVLMLREGWDVQNVTVIVGLRPYTSKANILPEQTIGRGLRLMFRDTISDYRERVDVIGNKTFIEFVEQLERDEDIEFDTFEVGKDKLEIVTVMPDPSKLHKDIAMPVLSPILNRKKSLAEEIAGLDVSKLKCPILPYKQTDTAAQQFHYEGYDFITLQKLVEREYTIPEPQTAEEVIGYYARRIAQDLKLPSQFAALVPKVREFFETRAFGERVALNSPAVIKAMSSNVANFVTVKTFVQALRELIIEEQEARLIGDSRHLSETPPFPYSRPTLAATKTVFNLVACDNEFEKEFARFLEGAPDVEKFAKLPERFGFVIEYTDAVTNLRYYEPDFVVATNSGNYYLVETKGQMSEDVPHKNRAAELWCENATILTGVPWAFLIVRQSEYNRLHPDEFADLSALRPISAPIGFPG